MKKAGLFFTFLLAGLTAAAQPVEQANFYGIDYSLCRVIGAQETPEQFRAVFGQINDLIVLEPTKYDIARFMRIRVPVTDVNVVAAGNADRDLSAIKGAYRSVTEEEVRSLVENYTIPQSDGTGLVFVAVALDKPKGQAEYQAVFFDIASREIIYRQEATGKARGFGLRNYWAGSLYWVLKDWRYPKNIHAGR